MENMRMETVSLLIYAKKHVEEAMAEYANQKFEKSIDSCNEVVISLLWALLDVRGIVVREEIRGSSVELLNEVEKYRSLDISSIKDSISNVINLVEFNGDKSKKMALDCLGSVSEVYSPILNIIKAQSLKTSKVF